LKQYKANSNIGGRKMFFFTNRVIYICNSLPEALTCSHSGPYIYLNIGWQILILISL